MRAPALVAALVAALAGCFSEPKRAEQDEDAGAKTRPVRLVHIAAPRLRAEDAQSRRRLEEAVGVASSVARLDAVIFGGEVIANDSGSADEAIAAFASLAGIVAAKRYVVLGERERKGVVPRDEVLRALEARGLLARRAGTYSDAPREGVRLIVVEVAGDGSLPPESRRAFQDELRAAKEPVIIVVGDGPPLEKSVGDLLRDEPRVKAVLHRAAIGSLTDTVGEPAFVATPPLDSAEPAVAVIEVGRGAVKVELRAVPSGEALHEWSAPLR